MEGVFHDGHTSMEGLEDIIIFRNMCYLKNLSDEEHVNFDDLFGKCQEPSSEATEEHEINVLIPCEEKQFCGSWSYQQQMLVSLFDLIEKNNHTISAMAKLLAQNSQQVEKSSVQTESPPLPTASPTRRKPALAPTDCSASSLCHRLFGRREYTYRLTLESEFPTVLYKERNFGLSVHLVNKSGDFVRNCNLVSLCLAICTNEGEWIHENRVGEDFMKGKTEVELYNGEASFLKLYARDVSRSYRDGKVNIVIYPKPSTLVYSSSGSVESYVDSNQIEPLLLQNISIKAKKKD